MVTCVVGCHMSPWLSPLSHVCMVVTFVTHCHHLDTCVHTAHPCSGPVWESMTSVGGIQMSRPTKPAKHMAMLVRREPCVWLSSVPACVTCVPVCHTLHPRLLTCAHPPSLSLAGRPPALVRRRGAAQALGLLHPAGGGGQQGWYGGHLWGLQGLHTCLTVVDECHVRHTSCHMSHVPAGQAVGHVLHQARRRAGAGGGAPARPAARPDH